MVSNAVLVKLVFAAFAAVCLVGLIHTYPDPEWWDEAWGAGALWFALLSFILP